MLFNNGFRLPRAGRGVPRPASDVSDDKTAVESAGKNDELFKSLRDVEDQVDAIVKSCTQNYIDGIKENIVRLVLNWFKDENKTDRFFFLFGNMGTFRLL